jgi:hypothetical protein
VLGCILRVLRLDQVEDGLNDLATTLSEKTLKGGLEVEGGSGSNGGSEEADDQGGYLLFEGKAGAAGLLQRSLKLWQNRGSQGQVRTLD